MRTALCVAGILLAGYCYLQARRFAQPLQSGAQTAVVLLNQPVDGLQANLMRELEEAQEFPHTFALWRQENEVSAENTDLQRRHTVAAVTVYGNTSLVLHGDAWLDESDRQGCLIDENTALHLFGTVNVIGSEIRVGGERRTIRGILRNAENTVIYEAQPEEAVFSYLTVRMGTYATYEQVQQDFLMRHGLQGNVMRFDLLGWLAELFCTLAVLLAGGRMLGVCVRLAWSMRGKRGALLPGIGVFLCAALLLALFFSRLSLPADVAPTKWSDFAYWNTWWERQRESMLLLMLTEKQKPLWQMMDNFYHSILFSFASGAAFMCLPLPKFRNKKV